MKVDFLDLQKINSSFEPELSEAVNKSIRSGRYILGPEVEQFENEFASYCGTRSCVGVGNGLEALIIIWQGLLLNGKLSKGDEVLVPANTYIASILSIIQVGLTPVFCEPSPQTCNLTVRNLDQYKTSNTKAVLMVHLYGQMSETAEIEEYCKKNDLILIEDAAQSQGATDNLGRRAGSIGYAAGFSFYPGKNLGALGDAGAITSNDESFAKLLATYRNYGSEVKYVNEIIGINSRLDPLQAAVLSVKLNRLDKDNSRRREIAKRYCTEISNPHLVLPALPEFEELHVWHVFTLRVKDRTKFQDFLSYQGISNLIHYPIAPHKQKAFPAFNSLSLPITEEIHREIISIPVSPVMNDDEVTAVIAACNEYKG